MQSEAIKYQPPVEGVVVTQEEEDQILKLGRIMSCLLYTSPSPRDGLLSRMPSSA